MEGLRVGAQRCVVIEGEVADAVEDHLPLVPLDRLEDVGVVAQHQVGAGIDGRIAYVPLVGREVDGREGKAPVERCDRDVHL